MKKKMLIALVLLCSFTAVFAWFADLNGSWSGTLNISDGQQFPLNYTFKIDGNKLTGTSVNDRGTSDLSDGKVKGDSLWFSIDAGGMNILHTGKYFAAGDSISLNIDYNGSPFHATLKRAADKK